MLTYTIRFVTYFEINENFQQTKPNEAKRKDLNFKFVFPKKKLHETIVQSPKGSIVPIKPQEKVLKKERNAKVRSEKK